MVYSSVGEIKDVCIYGFSDASFKAGEKAVGVQVVLLGNKDNDRKSKLMRKVCKSPKDAETRNSGITLDHFQFLGKQLEEILYGKNSKVIIPIRILTDNVGVLESITSSKQVARRRMRHDIEELKDQLENIKVEYYSWIQDEKMIANVLTKGKKEKFGVEGLLRDNRLSCVLSEDNIVTYDQGDYQIRGRKLKEKLLPKKKTPPLRKRLEKRKHQKMLEELKKKEGVQN